MDLHRKTKQRFIQINTRRAIWGQNFIFIRKDTWFVWKMQNVEVGKEIIRNERIKKWNIKKNGAKFEGRTPKQAQRNSKKTILRRR